MCAMVRGLSYGVFNCFFFPLEGPAKEENAGYTGLCKEIKGWINRDF